MDPINEAYQKVTQPIVEAVRTQKFETDISKFAGSGAQGEDKDLFLYFVKKGLATKKGDVITFYHAYGKDSTFAVGATPKKAQANLENIEGAV